MRKNIKNGVSNKSTINNLNSQLWQGNQPSDFDVMKKYRVYVDGESDTFYPILFRTSHLMLRCYINSPTYAGVRDDNTNVLYFILQAGGWSAMGDTFKILTENIIKPTSYTPITIGSVAAALYDTRFCAIWVKPIEDPDYYTIYSNIEPVLYKDGLNYTDGYGNSFSFMPGKSLTGGENINIKFFWKNDETRNNSITTTREYVANNYPSLQDFNSLKAEVESLKSKQASTLEMKEEIKPKFELGGGNSQRINKLQFKIKRLFSQERRRVA